MYTLIITGYILSDITRAVCWTLLHSMWQGLIAAAVAGVLILMTRHVKAALRYNLLAIIMISFIVASVITFLNQPGILRKSESFQIHALSSVQTTNVLLQTNGLDSWLPSIEKKTFFEPIIYFGNKYAPLITGLWVLVFLIHFLRMFAGLRQAYKLQYFHTMNPAQEWKERLNTLSSLLGIRNRVLLKESSIVKVPLLVGFLKPMILVPLGMFANLSVEQVETIFVHELAHVKRQDFAVNLLQRFVEAIFFFNPFVLWMSSLIRDEREASCDDIVLEFTSDKKSYLEALVSFRSTQLIDEKYVMALGSRESLLIRAKRILTNENKKLNVMEKLILILVVISLTAFGFIPGKQVKLQTSPILNEPTIKKSTSQEKTADVLIKTHGQARVKDSKDTLPNNQITFKSISSSSSDEGKIKTTDVRALGSDGKNYHYKTVNNEIKEFTIDGVSVGRNNYKSYAYLIGKIETEREGGITEALQRQESSLDMLQNKQQLLKLQQLQLENQALLLRDTLRLQSPPTPASPDVSLNLIMKQQLDLQSKNQLILEKTANLRADIQLNSKLDQLTNLQLAQEERRLSDFKAIPAPLPPLAPIHSDDAITNIIDDLTEAGIAQNKKSLSFTLNDDELIVNDKKQESDVFNRFKAKYIKSSKEHYIYKTDGHRTSVDVVSE